MSPTTLNLPPAVVSAEREVLSRAGRQVLQALLPTALILANGRSDVDLGAVVILAVVTFAVSVLNSAAGWKVAATAPVGLQLTQRAVVAAAGAALGYIVDGITVQTHVHWQALIVAAAGAAITALIHYYIDPPVVAEQDAHGAYKVSSLPDSVDEP